MPEPLLHTRSAAGQAAAEALAEAAERWSGRPRPLLIVDAEPPEPREGVLHVHLHRSLLPAFRGPEPVLRAMMAGAERTGWSAVRGGPTLDGPVLAQQAVRVRTKETGLGLTERLDRLLPDFCLALIETLAGGMPEGTPQDASRFSPAPAITPEDARIDWEAMDPRAAHDLVRALSGTSQPAWSAHGGERIGVLVGEVSPGTGSPGVVEAAGPGGIRVALRDGGMRLQRLLGADGEEIPPLTFPRRFPVGSRFGA